MWQILAGLALGALGFELYNRDKATKAAQPGGLPASSGSVPTGTPTPSGPATPSGPKVSVGSVIRVDSAKDLMGDATAQSSVGLPAGPNMPLATETVLTQLRQAEAGNSALLKGLLSQPMYQLKVTRQDDANYYGDLKFPNAPEVQALFSATLAGGLPITSLTAPVAVKKERIAEVISY